MIKKIKINNQLVSCRLVKHSKAGRLKLAIVSTNQIRVSIPRFTTFGFAERFLDKNIPWIESQFKKMEKAGTRLDAPSYHSHKARAKFFAMNRVEYYNQFYKYEYSSIRVKNNLRNWGSCSGKKNLNFNYRIMFLPLELADYVIVHELCHLREMNHSKDFWDLVNLAFPDYKTRRRELKKIMF